MTDGGCIAARGEECSMADELQLDHKADVVQFFWESNRNRWNRGNQALTTDVYPVLGPTN